MSFKLRGTLSGVQPTQMKCVVAAGVDGSIKVGQLVEVAEGRIASLLTNGDATAADTTLAFAATNSTDTVGVAGEVEIVMASDLLVEGKVTTAGNLSDSIRLRKCTLDLIGGVQTIDEDDATGAIMIHEVLDAAEGTALFVVPFKI